MPDILKVIRIKRDGGQLSEDQIRWFMDTYANSDDIAPEQASALLMAIFVHGMEPEELIVWTDAMIDSGERLDLSGLDRPTVDKHSTGGVGDKISLILVPLLAASGAAVPQLSGRGLGHTGGTLDKLEAIPGWSPVMDEAAILSQLSTLGGVIAGTTADIVPADRKMYALRDVTATVASIPLIASSIMSKKIAEGAESLVLDVKVGSGAFMREIDRARALAEVMVELGRSHGVNTVALLTNMDTVLGRAVGNGLEVQESLDVLAGHGPADVVEVTLALAQEMAQLAGVAADPVNVLESGEALHAFHDIVNAQGGVLEGGLAQAAHQKVIPATESGFVQRLDAKTVGLAAWRLGAGRAHKEDSVSPTAGVMCMAKQGEHISAGEPLFVLHTDNPQLFTGAEELLKSAVVAGSKPPKGTPLVLERVT